MTIGTPRRYYLLKRYAAKARRDPLEGTWRAKQEETAGAALPHDFPSRAKLVAAGYSTAEDLRGADAAELMTNASLSRREATAALAALELLP